MLALTSDARTNATHAREVLPADAPPAHVPRDDEQRPAAVRENVEAVARQLARPLSTGERRSIVRTVYASRFVYEIRGRIFHAGDENVAAILVTVERQPANQPPPRTLGLALGLTRRQSDVAALLARGMNNVELAHTLGISPHTARHHTEKVLQKLGVRSRQEVAAAMAAVDWGTIDPGRRDAESE